MALGGSQLVAAALFSQWSALLGLQRHTLALTQVLILSFSTWISLLQRADPGLIAAAAMWLHQFALIGAGNRRAATAASAAAATLAHAAEAVAEHGGGGAFGLRGFFGGSCGLLSGVFGGSSPADDEVINVAVYFGYLFFWSLALWMTSRHRDDNALHNRAMVEAAAERAERCQALVHEMLPPAGRGAGRGKSVRFVS